MKRNCLWFVYAVAGVVLPVTFSGNALLGAEAVASISVTDFGAKGDGKTDDSEAIQKALDKAMGSARKEQSGGTGALTTPEVVFPSGVYLISETIKVPSCITVKGKRRSKRAIIS